MIIKKHTAEGKRLILAICDDALLGKKFEEGKKQLDISNEFYGGDKASEDETMKLIERAYIVNAVGEEAVGCCVKAGLCKKQDALSIKGIPYFQAVLF